MKTLWRHNIKNMMKVVLNDFFLYFSTIYSCDGKAEFPVSSVSHDLSEIILICWLLLKKHFLLSMLKIVVLLDIFVETLIKKIKILWWIESSKGQYLFEIEIFCYINTCIFTVTFDRFHMSLLNKSINFFFFSYWPPPFVYIKLTLTALLFLFITLLNFLWTLDLVDTFNFVMICFFWILNLQAFIYLHPYHHHST